MSTYTLQTKTMLQSLSKTPSDIVGLPTKRDSRSKSELQLPTKRKRDTICGLGSFNETFVIKPCPASVYDKPATFKPIRIIGRSQLPFTFLDTSPNPAFPPNRLFSAQIDVLEEQHEEQNTENTSPQILIARYEANKALYAIERVQNRVFSLCKLASWLKEKGVSELWDPSSLVLYPAFPVLKRGGSDGRRWWQETVVEAESEENPTKRVHLSMRRPKPGPIEPKPDEELVSKAKESNEGASTCGNDPMAAPAPEIPFDISLEAPSPQQMLETLVQQYLDAIYMSKTSLAYFAKGPIARIRTAFTGGNEKAPPTHELAAFLRGMLLTHKAGDRKYREKLSEIVKSIPPGYLSDEDNEIAPKLRKSKKKTKLNREGIYPQEEDIVMKWWKSEMPTPDIHGEETLDQRIKRRVGDLRIRETLAQMILMLEIIALEALSTYKPPQEEDDVGDETQTQGETQPKPKKKRRKKQLDDINVQLDLLLDRLCIWQSVDQDDLFDFDARKDKKAGEKDGTGDRLQGFCVEVIVPFYMSRLPDQAIMINKKLGGPVHTSPPKRKAMKPPTTSRNSGEPKEPEAKKSRRSLGRVATDSMGQMSQRKPTPSLQRSTTDSAILNSIKREASEKPLSAIPAFQRSPSAASRQSMSQFKHMKGREIDLSAPSAAAAAKLKHKKRVEEDLQEAISALKKPNRGLAAGRYVDDIEKRGIGAVNRSRKPATTVRKIQREERDVQVSATPRMTKRTKDLDERTPFRNRNPFYRGDESSPLLTNNFRIPSSSARLSSSTVPATIQRSGTSRLARPSVAETPSKGPAAKVSLAGTSCNQEDCGIDRGPPFALGASSIAMEREAKAEEAMFETPSRPRSQLLDIELPRNNAATIFATPVKSRLAPLSPAQIVNTPPVVFKTPVKETTAAVANSPLASASKSAKEGEASIYDALGWNDDDDDMI